MEQILRLAEIFGTDANAVLYGPPVPESRRRAVFPTLTGIGLTAILWGVMVRLRPWVFACMKRNEYFLPVFVLSAVWKPIAWGMMGWTLTQLLSLFIPIRPPQTLYIRRVRRGLLVLALCGIALSALCWALIYSDVYNSLSYFLRQFLSRIVYFSLESHYFYAFFGMALRLLGFPAMRQATPKPQDVPAS